MLMYLSSIKKAEVNLYALTWKYPQDTVNWEKKVQCT